MKRVISSDILAGRDSHKEYKNIKFAGWTKGIKDIKDQIGLYLSAGDRKTSDELRRYVRYSISEAEDAANKLVEYMNILEKFNKSAKTQNDAQTLLTELDNFKFSQH